MECRPCNAKYYFVSPSVERGRQAESTASIGAEHGLLGNAYPTVAEGFAAAKADAEEGVQSSLEAVLLLWQIS